MTPMLGLSEEELESLLLRLVTRRPDMRRLVDQVRCRAEDRPRHQVRSLLPTLTRREVVVALAGFGQ